MAPSRTIDRERARSLRAEGWSLRAIAAEVGAGPGAVSVWCRGVEAGELRRTAQAHGPRRPSRLAVAKQREIEDLRLEGRRSVGVLNEREHLVAGLALYAGEGHKTGGTVRLTGTDPAIIGFCCGWLRRFYEPEERRLRVRLHLHSDLDLGAAQIAWSATTGIPIERFRAPHRPEPRPSTLRTRRHVHGCATVEYSCARTLRTILGQVEALLSSPPPFPG